MALIDYLVYGPASEGATERKRAAAAGVWFGGVHKIIKDHLFINANGQQRSRSQFVWFCNYYYPGTTRDFVAPAVINAESQATTISTVSLSLKRQRFWAGIFGM